MSDWSRSNVRAAMTSPVWAISNRELEMTRNLSSNSDQLMGLVASPFGEAMLISKQLALVFTLTRPGTADGNMASKAGSTLRRTFFAKVRIASSCRISSVIG